MAEKNSAVNELLAEKGVDLTLQSSGIQVAEIYNLESTKAEEARVLRKIDML